MQIYFKFLLGICGSIPQMLHILYLILLNLPFNCNLNLVCLNLNVRAIFLAVKPACHMAWYLGISRFLNLTLLAFIQVPCPHILHPARNIYPWSYLRTMKTAGFLSPLMKHRSKYRNDLSPVSALYRVTSDPGYIAHTCWKTSQDDNNSPSIYWVLNPFYFVTYRQLVPGYIARVFPWLVMLTIISLCILNAECIWLYNLRRLKFSRLLCSLTL